MEILDMTFAGIPVGLLIAVVAGWYFTRKHIRSFVPKTSGSLAWSMASIADSGSAKRMVVPAPT